MLKHTLAITLAVATVSLATPGMGSAGVACTPHCAPQQSSNSGGDLRGLNRTNHVAGEHGTHGRTNAQQKQDLYKPGGSGVSTSGGTTSPVTDSPVPPPGDTGGVGNPCSGC